MKREFKKRNFTKGYIIGRFSSSEAIYDKQYYMGNKKGYGFSLYPERDYLNPNSQTRHKFIDILLLLKKYSPGNCILDYGSGPGHLAYWSRKMNLPFKISMCDISAESGQIARELGLNNEFQKCSTDNLNFSDSAFNAIVISDVLEHVYPEKVGDMLKEIWRTLKPGGVVIIKTPNRITWDNRTYQDQSHVWLGTVSEMKDILKLSGFRVIKCFTRGFPWSAIYQRIFMHDFRSPIWGNAIYMVASKLEDSKGQC